VPQQAVEEFLWQKEKKEKGVVASEKVAARLFP